MCIDSSQRSNLARNMETEIKRAIHRITSKSRRKILVSLCGQTSLVLRFRISVMNIIYSSNRIAARSWIKKKRIASFRGEVKGIEKDRLFSTISNPLPRFHPSVPVVDHGAMHHLVSEATVRRSPLPKTSSLLPHFPFLPLPFSSPSPNVLSFCNKRTRKKRPAGV